MKIPIDQSEKIIIIMGMKNEKKVEKTKATLVREVEVKFGMDKGFLDSLERANKETIVKLLAL